MLPAVKISNVKTASFIGLIVDCAWFMCGMSCCMMCLDEGIS